jgi:hypothetical protein
LRPLQKFGPQQQAQIRELEERYLRFTAEVIDSMTCDAMLKALSRLVIPWRRAMYVKLL